MSHGTSFPKQEVEKDGIDDIEKEQIVSTRSRSNSSASVSSSTSSNLGPISSSSPQHQPAKVTSLFNLPPSLANLDAVHFTLDPLTTKKPKRITKDSFLNSGNRINDGVDPTDPLSQLDPLWSLHK